MRRPKGIRFSSKFSFNSSNTRSSLLYPPALLVRTSDPAIDSLAGVYTKTGQDERDFRPVYKHSVNPNYIYYEGEAGSLWPTFLSVSTLSASYWYIGGLTERRVRSNSSSGQLVIPFIGWELQQDDGQWRELRDQNSRQIFTLNITIQHGEWREGQTVCYKEQNYFKQDEPLRDDKMKTSDVLKMMDVKRMRTYDQLKELDIEENEESLR